MSLTPQALRLLSRQIVAHRNSPPEGVRIVVDEDNLTNMEGWVQGPSGTPYEGGYYKIRFSFGPEFPNLPPKCTMITKIFHPNISKAGEICVDTLKKGWKKEYGVEHVLVTIKCLLIYPNPESALDEEAGKQLLEDYEGYSKYARLMTSIHATPKLPPAEFRGASSSDEKSLPSNESVHTTTVRPATTAPSSASSSASKPSPLGTSISQGQSPNASREKTSGEEVKKVVKSAGKSAGTGTSAGGVKTAVASKAKRGAKRL
ncbi:hypothetical protein IAR50_002814 [Cryptococcus sp. DSM 104548]